MLKDTVFRGIAGQIKSALIMMALIAVELTVGFVILRVPYSGASGVAHRRDGCVAHHRRGTVFDPHVGIGFITGDIGLGVGVAILYILTIVTRQIVEPRVVSVQLGLYPLVTMAAMYAGLCVMGFGGMLLGPVMVFILKAALNSPPIPLCPRRAGRIAIFANRSVRPRRAFDVNVGAGQTISRRGRWFSRCAPARRNCPPSRRYWGKLVLIDELVRRLHAIAADEQIFENEPLDKHTTMRVGGVADIYFLPDSAAQIAQALSCARELDVPVLLMGNGSNLIVRDGGVRGLVIALGERYSRIRVQGEELTAQAGASLARVAAAAQEAGFPAWNLPPASPARSAAA